MMIYHLRSFAVSGKVIAVQRFSAETEGEALSIARAMVKVTSSEVAAFELWQHKRRVHAEARKGKPRR